MTELKRITPEQVVEAYRRTGWKPRQETFFDEIQGKHCACGLAAMVGEAEKILSLGLETVSEFAELLELNLDYASGFVGGFDGNAFNPGWSPIMIIGYDDGRACWEAAKREVLGA